MADEPNIRHLKPASIIKKLRDPKTKWAASRLSNEPNRIATSHVEHERWTIAIYARLAGWKDMSELKAPMPRIARERMPGYALNQVRDLYTKVVFGQETMPDILKPACVLYLERDMYIDPGLYAEEEQEEIKGMLELLTSDDTALHLHNAHARPTWEQFGTMRALYAAVAGLTRLMSVPYTPSSIKINAGVHKWLEAQRAR